jgi:hypothetical protein
MWYESAADAVFQNIDIIASIDTEYIIILVGDHIYKMDYELMLRPDAVVLHALWERSHGVMGGWTGRYDDRCQ